MDVLLSPLDNDARVLDAYKDPNDRIHLLFWGGNNQYANIYYASARLAEADNSRAWSGPVLAATNAGDPENAVFVSHGSEPIRILYSGRQDGNGLYAVSSADAGQTWSKPLMIAPTQSRDYLVSNLSAFVSNSGWSRVIWNEVTGTGQGRAIIYTQISGDETSWSEPIVLAKAETGLGTSTPALYEYGDTVLVFYNLGLAIWGQTSPDGQTWSAPNVLFRRHVGVNGALSLAVDTNGVLHMLFGQRIPGPPDIHGMWHSTWTGANWTVPEAVVSGPHVADLVGDSAFDPFGARAVVSQGNVLLATWRTDPGNAGNGVWFSFRLLDAPELPQEPLAAPATTEIPTGTVVGPNSLMTPTTTPAATAEVIPVNDDGGAGPQSTNPGFGLAAGVASVLALIVIVGGSKFLAPSRRR